MAKGKREKLEMQLLSLMLCVFIQGFVTLGERSGEESNNNLRKKCTQDALVDATACVFVSSRTA
jgi:hypothetical protein